MKLDLTTHGRLVATVFLGLASSNASAADGEVAIRVTNISSSQGEIGCALFPAGAAFPMDGSKARQVWQKADASGVICKFEKVAEGNWAVSVSHDLNGNRTVDTNFLGMPTEPWGVSNNVRPGLRAPKFAEAAFKVAAGQSVAIEIRVDK